MSYYSKSSCPTLFICTAILCWDSNFLNYSFFNITKCTPSSLYLKSNLQLISINNKHSRSKFSTNGFICSNCTRENFIEYNLNQCSKEKTMIELRNYCHYKSSNNSCQCSVSNKPIQPIKNWAKALVEPGKSHRNIIRVNDINKSSSSSVYILTSFIIFLVIFGGIIGMIFYWIKFKQLQTFK